MRRPLALLVLALVASACGTKTATTRDAETEGLYVDVGGLKYQVQVSRQLNQLTVDDQSYLRGLTGADARLRPGEVYFAVLLRAQNDSSDGGAPPIPSASSFEIRDSQENVYTPLPVPVTGPQRNLFAYSSTLMRPADVLPPPDSPAGERPPYGAALVFKLRRFSVENRPLELVIKSRQVPQTEATVNLDV